MDSTGLSYGSSSRQRSNARNPSNPRDAKASQAVSDWAAKKREQLERAKQLREERKYGSSHLKNAGETQVVSSNGPGQNLTPSNNMRNSQHARPALPRDGMAQLQPPPGTEPGYGQYNEFLTDNHNYGGGRQSPAYGNGGAPTQFDLGQNSSGYEHNTTPQNHRRRQTTTAHGAAEQINLAPGHQHSALTPSHNNFGGGQFGGLGGLSTQDNFRRNNQYSYQPGEGNRLNTISHDLGAADGGGHDPNMTQLSGGFPKNPLSRRGTGASGGFLNQTADGDPRMRQTAYTKQEVQEARDGLKLLKSRMGGVNKKRGLSNSQSTNRDRDPFSQEKSVPMNQSSAMIGNRRSQYGGLQGASKPPMMPPSSHHNVETMNTSANGPTPRNSNYRKAFKPSLGPGGSSSGGNQGVNQSMDQYHSGGGSSFEDQQQNRMIGQGHGSTNYEPARRSPNTMRRQLSTNQRNAAQGRGPAQHGYAGAQGDDDVGGDDEARAFGQSSKPRVANSPEGGRASPGRSQQPSQKYGSSFKGGGGGGGLSIYEQAALEAGQGALPDNMPAQLAAIDDGSRTPCPSCGRKFNSEALAKHERICQKVFQQKRKAFDAKASRKAGVQGLEELEREQSYQKPFGKAGAKKRTAKAAPAQAPGKLPKWKAQSLAFRQAMRAGNDDGGGGGSGAGGFNPSQEASQAHDDRIECKWCGRKFNEEAGKRHIPYCEQKYKQNLMKNGGPKGKSAKAMPKRGTQIGFRKQQF